MRTIHAVLVRAMLFLFVISCTKKPSSEQYAFEIKRGTTTNRVYAAYDSDNPLQISWYFCKDEPADPNTPVNVSQVGPLALGVRIAQAINNQPPMELAFVEKKEAGLEMPSAVFERIALNRVIRLSERMTIKEFQDPVSGKGCSPMVANAEVLASNTNRSNVTGYFEKKVDVETTALMVGSLFSCLGAGKEALLTGASFIQGLKGIDPLLYKSYLGFQSAALKPSNAGAIIWALVSGGTFCALSSRGLFNKVTEKFALTDPNRAALFSYMDIVSVKAENLLQASKWVDTLTNDEFERVAYLKEEVEKEEVNLELSKKQLQITSASSAVSIKAAMVYGSVYSPLFVATWNAIENIKVTEESSAQGRFMTRVVDGMNSVLGGISKVLTGPTTLPSK